MKKCNTCRHDNTETCNGCQLLRGDSRLPNLFALKLKDTPQLPHPHNQDVAEEDTDDPYNPVVYKFPKITHSHTGHECEHSHTLFDRTAGIFWLGEVGFVRS